MMSNFGISGSGSRERNTRTPRRATTSTTTANGLWRKSRALQGREDSSRTTPTLETPSIFWNFEGLSSRRVAFLGSAMSGVVFSGSKARD